MSYKRNIWNNNDLITEEKLNRLEYAVESGFLGEYDWTRTPDITSYINKGNESLNIASQPEIKVKYVSTTIDLLNIYNALFYEDESTYEEVQFPFILVTDNDTYFVQKGIQWIPLALDKESSSDTDVVYKIANTSGYNSYISNIKLTNDNIQIALAIGQNREDEYAEEPVRWLYCNRTDTRYSSWNILTRSSETGNYTGTTSWTSFYNSTASFDGETLTLTGLSYHSSTSSVQFGFGYILPILGDSEGLKYSDVSFYNNSDTLLKSLGDCLVSITSLTRRDIFGNRLKSLNGLPPLDFKDVNTYLEENTMTIQVR